MESCLKEARTRLFSQAERGGRYLECSGNAPEPGGIDIDAQFDPCNFGGGKTAGQGESSTLYPLIWRDCLTAPPISTRPRHMTTSRLLKAFVMK